MRLTILETGEVVDPMTRVEAERITQRIADKLDAIADAHEQVLPLIGEAMTRQAWKTLGYQSPQSYVSERFGRSLERLNAPVRRAVVAELSEAGMSTREIAPIVGASRETIRRDVSTDTSVSVANANPVLSPPSAETPDETETTAHGLPKSEYIVDRRGYKHQRPEPQARQDPQKPRRRPITEAASDAGWDARKTAERTQRLINDDRFARNKEEVATLLRSHLQFAVETYTEILDQLDS